jgi:hypothetical protein
MNQALFGTRPIRDAATGKIATLTRDRNLNFRRTTRPVAALGEWEDTFSRVTSGISNLTNSISGIIGSIKGNVTNVNANTGGYPMQQMYYGQQPYYGVNPMVPSYNYPVQPQVPRTTTNNTLLYTGLGVAALAGFIFLKNK